MILHALNPREMMSYLPAVHVSYVRASGLGYTWEEFRELFETGIIILIRDEESDEVQGGILFDGVRQGNTATAHGYFIGLTHEERLAATLQVGYEMVYQFDLMRIETRIPVFRNDVVSFFEELGFTRVGRIPHAMRIEEQPADVFLYVMTAEEFQDGRRRILAEHQ